MSSIKRIIKVCILLLMVYFVVTGNTTAEERIIGKSGLVYIIPITGEIDQGLYKLLDRGINSAEQESAELVILEIDTFGGYVDSATAIKDRIFSSELPVVAFVKGRAWSAGALITLAGERIGMVPGSSMGAAETRPKEEKYISAFRKEFKATAESRGRDPQLAAAMVDADIEIPGVIDKGKLLTLTATEALEQGMADYKVNNLNQLYDALQFTPLRIVEVKMTSPEEAARIITRPNITTVLISLGVIGLIAEAFLLGWGVAGTLGLISLGLVFSSYIYLGIASWGLVILFLVGIILLALEVFVVPGFGITGIGGIAAIFTSLYFLFPTPEQAIAALATVLIISIVTFILLIKIFGSSHLWKRISLKESQTREAGYLAQHTHQDLIGRTGLALTTLRPAGIADLGETRVDVVSEGGFIEKGSEIEVIKIAGNRIVVKQILRKGD